MVELVLPERQQEEWRRKLESLQNQHRSESREQQTQHLQQLRLLQEQLLQDITLNLSSMPGLGRGQCHALPSQDIQAQVCKPKSEADDTCQSESPSSVVTNTGSRGSPLQIEAGRCGEKPVASCTSPSLLTECDSGKTSLFTVETVSYERALEDGTENRDVSPKGTFHTHTPPPLMIRDLHGSSERDHKSNVDISLSPAASLPLSPANSPARIKIASKSPKGATTSTSPFFHPVSPKQAWAGPSVHPPSPLSLSIRVPPSPPENKPCFVQTSLNLLQGVEDRAEQPPDTQYSRASLLDKHARHVQDLKAFYESELSTLSERLRMMEQRSNKGGKWTTPTITTPTRRSLNFDGCTEGTMSPVIDSHWSVSKEPMTMPSGRWREDGTATDLERVEAENVRLEGQCYRLQTLLDDTRR